MVLTAAEATPPGQNSLILVLDEPGGREQGNLLYVVSDHFSVCALVRVGCRVDQGQTERLRLLSWTRSTSGDSRREYKSWERGNYEDSIFNHGKESSPEEEEERQLRKLQNRDRTTSNMSPGRASEDLKVFRAPNKLGTRKAAQTSESPDSERGGGGFNVDIRERRRQDISMDFSSGKNTANWRTPIHSADRGFICCLLVEESSWTQSLFSVPWTILLTAPHFTQHYSYPLSLSPGPWASWV